jgi:hypothetical protein
MEDDWELRFGLDPKDPADAGLDPDDDDLTNLEEFQLYRDLGWDLNPKNPDTDEDGWEDGDEVSRSFNPMDPSDHPEDKYSGIPTILYLAFLFVMILALLFVIVFLVIRRRNKPKAIASQAALYPAASYDQSLQQVGGYPMVQGAEYQQLPPAQVDQGEQFQDQYYGADQYQQYPDQGQYQDYQSEQGQEPYPQDQSYEGYQEQSGYDQFTQPEAPDSNVNGVEPPSYYQGDDLQGPDMDDDPVTGTAETPGTDIPGEDNVPVPGSDESVPGNKAPEIGNEPQAPEEESSTDRVSRIPKPPDLPDI